MIKTSVHLAAFCLTLLVGCSAINPTYKKSVETWVGRTTEEIWTHWGIPTSVIDLTSSGGKLLTYHEVDERQGKDNRAFCEALGLGSGWADVCNSEGEIVRSECMVNVATTDDGIIRDMAIVRDIPGGVFGICNRIIKAAPTSHRSTVGTEPIAYEIEPAE